MTDYLATTTPVKKTDTGKVGKKRRSFIPSHLGMRRRAFFYQEALSWFCCLYEDHCLWKDSVQYACVKGPGALYVEMSEIEASDSSSKFLHHQGHELTRYQWGGGEKSIWTTKYEYAAELFEILVLFRLPCELLNPVHTCKECFTNSLKITSEPKNSLKVINMYHFNNILEFTKSELFMRPAVTSSGKKNKWITKVNSVFLNVV